VIGSDAPVYLNAIIKLEVKVFEYIGFGYTLRIAWTVFDDDECSLGKDAKPVDPASKKNFMINKLTEGIDERALVEFGLHSGKSFYPENFRWNHKSNCGGAIQLPTNAALVCAVS
jgi:hypothetical protein